MPSVIDPTKPSDGVPAAKSDLRANLLAAQTELEHGGFAEGLSPVNYGPPATSRVVDHLQAIDDTLGAGVGASAFLELSDVPSSYAGQANRYPRVKTDESGLEFVEQAAGGDASTTNYTQAGTGAVTRTVQSRLRDLVSVKDFGATGNGSTDDRAAIQAAIDYVGNLSTIDTKGGWLFFPPGRYLIQDLLISTRNVSFISCAQGARIVAGASFPATTLQAGKTFPTPMLWVNNVNGGEHARQMSQMHFDGDDKAPYGLLVTAGASWQFSSIIVQDTLSDGIVLDALQNSSFYNLRTSRNGRHAVRLTNSCRYIGFYQCFLRDMGLIGYMIEEADTNLPGNGIFTTGITNTNVVGGLIEGSKSGFTKTHCVNIQSGLLHYLYGVEFFAPCSIAFVESSRPLVKLINCNWGGGLTSVRAFVTSGARNELISPHFNAFSASGNLVECSAVDGLYVERPNFQSTTASGKLIASTPSFDARKVTYQDFRTQGSTGQRPAMSQIDASTMFWDTTLGQPIWWDPIAQTWKNATGTAV